MQGRFQIGYYWVARAFLYFDLSILPTGKTIISATVTVIGYYYGLTHVSIQEGTQGATLSTTDFNAFSGESFSIISWQAAAYPTFLPNTMELNAEGRLYVKEKLGATAKFCLREYTKDYLNIEPTGPGAGNGMYFANSPWTEAKPYLTIIYK